MNNSGKEAEKEPMMGRCYTKFLLLLSIVFSSSLFSEPLPRFTNTIGGLKFYNVNAAEEERKVESFLDFIEVIAGEGPVSPEDVRWAWSSPAENETEELATKRAELRRTYPYRFAVDRLYPLFQEVRFVELRPTVKSKREELKSLLRRDNPWRLNWRGEPSLLVDRTTSTRTAFSSIDIVEKVLRLGYYRDEMFLGSSVSERTDSDNKFRFNEKGEQEFSTLPEKKGQLWLKSIGFDSDQLVRVNIKNEQSGFGNIRVSLLNSRNQELVSSEEHQLAGGRRTSLVFYEISPELIRPFYKDWGDNRDRYIFALKIEADAPLEQVEISQAPNPIPERSPKYKGAYIPEHSNAPVIVDESKHLLEAEIVPSLKDAHPLIQRAILEEGARLDQAVLRNLDTYLWLHSFYDSKSGLNHVLFFQKDSRELFYGVTKFTEYDTEKEEGQWTVEEGESIEEHTRLFRVPLEFYHVTYTNFQRLNDHRNRASLWGVNRDGEKTIEYFELEASSSNLGDNPPKLFYYK